MDWRWREIETDPDVLARIVDLVHAETARS